jgi:hypothetical protein
MFYFDSAVIFLLTHCYEKLIYMKSKSYKQTDLSTQRAIREVFNFDEIIMLQSQAHFWCSMDNNKSNLSASQMPRRSRLTPLTPPPQASPHATPNSTALMLRSTYYGKGKSYEVSLMTVT